MYRLARAFLFRLGPERAHGWAMALLVALGAWVPLARLFRRLFTRGLPDLSVRIAGLTFPSPLGLAAGLDKDAHAVAGLFALGFGAVEVGTVTPRPQPGNPPPRLFRLPEHGALINRMGFNNAGAEAMQRRLERLAFRPGPVGVNLGKNKDTPLDAAEEDYLRGVDALAGHADYLVVNASSPNTPGLRALQESARLESLLLAVQARVRRLIRPVPVFLKIAPDLSDEAVDAAVDVALRCGIAGLIATNTTIERPVQHTLAQEGGGLSGAPLRDRSTAVVRRAYQRSNGALPIIGVGGVFTAEDAYEKIRAGASLVQVYSGLIYEGPSLPRRILRGLARLLRQDGFDSLERAVGTATRGVP